MNERMYYSKEAEERAQRDRIVGILVFMALGLGIGAVLALMFAPKSGEQLRKELASTIEGSVGRQDQYNALQRLEKEFADLRKRVEDRLENIR